MNVDLRGFSVYNEECIDAFSILPGGAARIAKDLPVNQGIGWYLQ